MEKLVEDSCTSSKMRRIVDPDEKFNNSSNNHGEEEQEDEEALSLCDLPINEEKHQPRKESNIPPKPIIDTQEEFNFCSRGDSLSKESEMCVADEVFFQGQILPMRHSISFDSGMITGRTASKCLSRSESMDHCSYSVGLSSVSSRSSSINSHHSSSSGSSSTGTVPIYKFRSKVPNHFQFSHPSPKPQVRSSNFKSNGGQMGINPNRKSTFWSFLRVGLVTTPELAVQDLKLRSKGNNSTKNFGSRNSSCSISSTFSNNSSTIKEADKKQKQQHKLFEKNNVIFSGCKCSSNAVVGPFPSRVRINATMRSASANGESHAHEHEEENSAMGTHNRRTTKHQQQTGKQSSSRHRTFEWLKQLSLEAAVVIDEAEQSQQ